MENSLIHFINRKTGQQEVEKIYGDGVIRFFYQNDFGKKVNFILANHFVSKLYGHLQDLNSSGKKVPDFVKKFNINTQDYQKGSFSNQPFELSFKSFNEFFIRKFKDQKRVFNQDSSIMPAFCESRYFGFKENTENLTLPVKGKFLKAEDLLADSKLGLDFKQGPILVARLCPVDYHRYHYPADGKTLTSYQIPGGLHSVNPFALRYKQDIMIKNERRVSILETKDFGKLAYIEVGATCVGKIVQTFNEDNNFSRGDEKGYFLFGGSTVIVLGEKGKWCPSEDILTNTQKGLETLVELGQEIANQSS